MYQKESEFLIPLQLISSNKKKRVKKVKSRIVTGSGSRSGSGLMIKLGSGSLKMFLKYIQIVAMYHYFVIFSYKH
jgi:hypothetical protein